MAFQALVTAVRDKLAAGLGSVPVYNRRVPPDLTEADLPLVVFIVAEATGKAFFGGSEEDHFATITVYCFGQADAGSAALRAVVQAVYDSLDRKTMSAVAGYTGVQAARLVRGETQQIEPNMYVCQSTYSVFGSVDVP